MGYIGGNGGVRWDEGVRYMRGKGVVRRDEGGGGMIVEAGIKMWAR